MHLGFRGTHRCVCRKIELYAAHTGHATTTTACGLLYTHTYIYICLYINKYICNLYASRVKEHT